MLCENEHITSKDYPEKVAKVCGVAFVDDLLVICNDGEIQVDANKEMAAHTSDASTNTDDEIDE